MKIIISESFISALADVMWTQEFIEHGAHLLLITDFTTGSRKIHRFDDEDNHVCAAQVWKYPAKEETVGSNERKKEIQRQKINRWGIYWFSICYEYDGSKLQIAALTFYILRFDFSIRTHHKWCIVVNTSNFVELHLI